MEKTDYYAPLVVVQIIAGILLGPGALGKAFPEYYRFVFNPQVVLLLNGIAWWAVMMFVFVPGIELDLAKTWCYRRESMVTAGLALGTPLLFGAGAGALMLTMDGWVGEAGHPWQFIMGVGMSCAVTTLPILILLMEKLEILRQPIGQRILRYASLDDIAIWGVLALILLDWERVGRKGLFLAGFAMVGWLYRKFMQRLPKEDRWFVGIIWLTACGFTADWAGLHYMVGAFLAGAVTDQDWFQQAQMDLLRKHLLLTLMPVFFLSTGLRTDWQMGGLVVFVAAA